MNSIAKKFWPLSIEMRATLLVALSATLYGCLAFFGTKLIHLQFTISAMLFWRFFIAGLWMLPLVWKKAKPTAPKNYNQYDFLKAFFLGGGCYACNSGLYFVASHYIGTGLAMVIFFTYPVFVALLAWAIDKHAITKCMISALISIGVGLLLLQTNHTAVLNITGVFFAIASAVFYAFYIFGSKHTARNMPSRYLTFFVCAGCSLVFLSITLIQHEFIWPTSLTAWCYVIALGIIATALPIQLLLEGLKYIHPCKVAILSVLEPVVTLIVGITLLQESTSSIQLIGCVIILLSAVIIQFER